MLSVDGQRGRPSAEARLDLLKVVGSSPARLASADVERSFFSASRSIADQMRAWDSSRRPSVPAVPRKNRETGINTFPTYPRSEGM
jgi:hypothetical protein